MAGLGFEISADDKKLLDAVKRSEKAIEDFSDKAESAGESIEQAFDDAVSISKKLEDQINKQKKAIDELEKQYIEAKDTFNNTDVDLGNPLQVEQYEKAKQLLNEVNNELIEQRDQLGLIEAAQKKHAATVANAKKETVSKLEQERTAWNDTLVSVAEYAEAIQFQKNHIKDLNDQLQQTKQQTKEMAGVLASIQTDSAHKREKQNEYNELVAKSKELQAAIKDEEDGLKKLAKGYDNLKKQQEKQALATEKEITILTQMKRIREEMASLVNTDGSISPENMARYDELKAKLAEVGMSYRKVQQEQKLLTTAGSAQLAGMVQGLSSFAGIFSAGQGFFSFFIKNNEKLAAIQTKLQAVMAITIGLQQVSTALHATSAFRIQTVTKATQLLSTAQTWLAAKFGISDAAAKKLLATLSFGLAVVITAVIALINKYITEQERAAETTRKFNESAASGAAKQRVEFEKLRQQWIAASGDLKAKEKLIRENISAYNSFGIKINDVNDADKMFIDNASNFRDSIMMRARSVAAMEIATEKYKEYLQKMADAERRATDRSFFESIADGAESFKNRFESLMQSVSSGKYVENLGEGYFAEQAAQRDKQKAEELNKESQDWILKAMGYDEKTIESLNKTGGKLTNEIIDGSKAHWQNIRDRQQKIMDDSIPDSSAFNAAKAQRDKADKMLEQWNKTNFKGQESAAEKSRKLAEARLAALRKLDEADTQRQLDKQSFDISMRQKSIDNMKDSFDKEYAQIALNHNKELQAIESHKKKMAKAQYETAKEQYISRHGNDNGFEDFYRNIDFTRTMPVGLRPEDIAAQVKQMTDAANATRKKAEEDLVKSLTDKYQSYADQRLAIEKKYNDDINVLIDQRDKAIELGDTKQADLLNRSVAKAIADKGKELMSFDYDRLKESPEYVRAFEDLKNTSSETLNSLLKQLEDAKHTAAAVLSPDQLREYTKTIQSIMDELDERNPFQTLIDSRQELAAAGMELAAAEKQLKEVQSGLGIVKSVSTVDGKMAITYLSEADALRIVSEAKDRYNKASNKVVEADKRAKGIIDKLSESLINLGASIGGTTGEIISLIGDIGLFTTATIEGIAKVSKKGEEAISAVEKASVILAIISTAFQIATKITSMFGADYSAYNKAKDAYESYIEVLDQVIAKQKELVQTMTGENAKNSYEYALNLIKAQEEAARELGKQRLNAGASAGSHSIGVRTRKNMSQEGWNQARSVLGKDFNKATDGRMTGLFDLSIDQLRELQEKAPSFWAQLDGDVKNYLQSIIDSNDAALDLQETLRETYTGISFDSLKDSLDDLIKAVDTTFEDIGDSFEDHMRTAVLNFVKNDYLIDALREWYEKFADAYSDGVISDSEVKALQKMYEDAYNKAQNMYDSALEAAGIDKESSNSSRSGDSKGIQAITQDSANRIEGTINNMLLKISDIRNINEAIRLQSIGINNGIVNLVEISRESISIIREQLVIQIKIEQNTAETARILNEIDKRGLTIRN